MPDNERKMAPILGLRFRLCVQNEETCTCGMKRDEKETARLLARQTRTEAETDGSDG